MIDYLLFYVPLKNILLVTITGEGLQNLGLCSALRAFGQREISIDLCRSRCGTIKTPPCSKALSAEHRPKGAGPRRVKIGPIKWAKLN
jgi:hypothetical protein